MEAPTVSKKLHKDVFDWYVSTLDNNILGLNYGAINLIIFFGIYPLVGAWLLWRLLNKLL